MKATKKEAKRDIQWRDFESIIFPPTKNHKNRNCLFCGKNIKGGEQYFRHFEYTYEANQKRWKACINCFNKIYEEMPPLNPMCKKEEVSNGNHKTDA